MTNAPPDFESVDPRQRAILDAAWHVFAAYGVRKTSMDDIAQRAGMSRPALYVHYRNKNDIFRSLVQIYYDTAVAAVTAGLNGDGSIHDRIERAFLAQGGDTAEAMLTSPHGREILEDGSAAAADIIATGETRLTAVYADWLTREAGRKSLRLTGGAGDIAATITAALKGIKSTAPDYPTYRRQVIELARLCGAALHPLTR